MRTQVAQFLNMERTNRGLSALPVDADLQSQAQTWSEHNRDVGCESGCHSPHDQGEILAWAPVSARSGTLTVAWMKSASHRNIVLYPDATALGVGIACKHGSEVYATVQFRGVHQPVSTTDEQPMVTSEEWGSPCEGLTGPVPTTTTSTTATTVPRTTTTRATPPPRPPTPTRVTETTAVALVTTPTVAPTTTTTAAPSPTTMIAPRVGLRSDGEAVNAPTPSRAEKEALLADAAATPASAEPAWVAIVVVVVLLSTLRIAEQLRDLRAARRLEDGDSGAAL